MTDNNVELKRGLRDIFIDRTESSFIDGKAGKLLYRGYDIHDLATQSSFEETTYLMLYGALPTSAQLSELDATLRASREIPQPVIEVIRQISHAHPMDVLRTAVSALAAFDPETADNSPAASLRKGARITAQVPTVVAAHAQIRDGKDVVAPDESLSHAGNFLYMLFGERPESEDTSLIDRDLVLHADHGINASAFTARVAASTRTDIHAAITAGVATLKGPIHGGAAEGVMKMALEIGSRDRVRDYVKELRSQGKPVMGFGHPVYKTLDPRSVHLRDGARTLSDRKGRPEWFSVLEEVLKVMEPYARKGVHPNVDFWSGAVYSLLGIPDNLFISIFAIGRIPGWTSQIMEQYSANYIIRPRLLYSGPKDATYIPIEERA